MHINVVIGIKKKLISLTLMLLMILARDVQASNWEEKQSSVNVGKTTKAEIVALFGQPAEELADGSRMILIYADVIKVPSLVSLIPVIGEIADGVELLHHNREYIIQLDEQGLVHRHKIRDID